MSWCFQRVVMDCSRIDVLILRILSNVYRSCTGCAVWQVVGPAQLLRHGQTPDAFPILALGSPVDTYRSCWLLQSEWLCSPSISATAVSPPLLGSNTPGRRLLRGQIQSLVAPSSTVLLLLVDSDANCQLGFIGGGSRAVCGERKDDPGLEDHKDLVCYWPSLDFCIICTPRDTRNGPIRALQRALLSLHRRNACHQGGQRR